MAELVSLGLHPVIDQELFLPPPGSMIGERLGEALGPGGPEWWALKTAAGLAALASTMTSTGSATRATGEIVLLMLGRLVITTSSASRPHTVARRRRSSRVLISSQAGHRKERVAAPDR